MNRLHDALVMAAAILVTAIAWVPVWAPTIGYFRHEQQQQAQPERAAKQDRLTAYASSRK